MMKHEKLFHKLYETINQARCDVEAHDEHDEMRDVQNLADELRAVETSLAEIVTRQNVVDAFYEFETTLRNMTHANEFCDVSLWEQLNAINEHARAVYDEFSNFVQSMMSEIEVYDEN